MTLNGKPISDAERIRLMIEIECEDSNDHDYLQASTTPSIAPPGPRPPPTIAEMDPDDCCADARFEILAARFPGLHAAALGLMGLQVLED